jgi:hypothetical protein
MLNQNLRRLATIAIFCTLPFSAIAEPYKQGDKHLTKSQLTQYGPVTLQVDDARSFRVVSVKYAKKPGRNCKLDVGGLKKMVASRMQSEAWKQAALTNAKIKFELKSDTDAHGEIICMGNGKGCIVTIEGGV